MPRPRKPYNPAGHLGMPTKERYAKRGEGFDMENLAPPGAPPVVRSKERSPLTSPAGRELAHDQRNETGGRKQQMTFLDKALEDVEVHSLFRFIIGTMVSESRMRLGGEDGRSPVFIKSDGNNRLPFSNAERLEIGARQFIYAKLPFESQRDIDILTDQVMPRDRKFYVSPVEFGRIVSRSSDERVARGAFIGTMKKLAHHVNHLYVEWELIQFRRKQEAKALRKSEESAPRELSTTILKRVVA